MRDKKRNGERFEGVVEERRKRRKFNIGRRIVVRRSSRVSKMMEVSYALF